MIIKLILVKQNGLIDGTYTAVEHLRRDRGGKGGVIVNIASTAGNRSTIARSVNSFSVVFRKAIDLYYNIMMCTICIT